MGELVQTWLISGKENFWDSFEEPQLNLIEYNTNLIATDLQRKPNCYNAQKPIDQVLIAMQLYASGCLLQVVGDTTGVDKSIVSLTVHKADAILEAITVLTHGKLHYGILIVG